MILILTQRQLRREMAKTRMETLQLHDFLVDHKTLADAALVIYVESTKRTVVLKAVRAEPGRQIMTLDQALKLVPLHIVH